MKTLLFSLSIILLSSFVNRFPSQIQIVINGKVENLVVKRGVKNKIEILAKDLKNYSIQSNDGTVVMTNNNYYLTPHKESTKVMITVSTVENGTKINLGTFVAKVIE